MFQRVKFRSNKIRSNSIKQFALTLDYFIVNLFSLFYQMLSLLFLYSNLHCLNVFCTQEIYIVYLVTVTFQVKNDLFQSKIVQQSQQNTEYFDFTKGIILFKTFYFHSIIMHPKPQQQRSTLNTTECCFTQFFSHNPSQDPCIKKNPSGLINPYSDQKTLIYQNQLVFPPKIIRPQTSNSKRSISSMKSKKRVTNRCSYEAQKNRKLRRDQYITQKLKSPLKGSEAVQRYFSPKPQINTTMSRSQLQDKKKIEEYFNVRNIQNRTDNFSGKPHTFFKKEKLNQPIQFARCMKQSNPEPVQTVSPNIIIGLKHDKADKIQHINKNGLNPDLNVEVLVNMERRQSAQKQQDLNRSYPLQNLERQEKPKLYQRPPQNISKKQNPVEISIHNSINLKLSEPKNRRQSAEGKLAALQKICETSKQQSRHQVYLQAPINHFQHINSFVEVRKGKGDPDEDLKQYDSIKTKGRPVESMLQMTKDLTKTRKHKKYPYKSNQNGLHDMDNITVTSQFDEDSQDDARERIEESAVLLNFFNPPIHLRDRMELSRANKQVSQER